MGSAGFIITYMAAGIFGYVDAPQSSTVEGADKGHKVTSLAETLLFPEYRPLVPLVQFSECSPSVTHSTRIHLLAC